VKGGQPRQTKPDEIEWRTGTYLDQFTPLYRSLLTVYGIKEHEARQMDITNVALTLGVPAHGVQGPSLADVMEQAPTPTTPEGEHIPGTAPPNIPPPRWWRGNRAAFQSSVGAASDLNMVFNRADRDVAG
jgi:hypothetical protein